MLTYLMLLLFFFFSWFTWFWISNEFFWGTAEIQLGFWNFSFICTWVCLVLEKIEFSPLSARGYLWRSTYIAYVIQILNLRLSFYFVLVGHDWWYRKPAYTNSKHNTGHNCLRNCSMHVDSRPMCIERLQTQLCVALLWMACLFWLLLTFILFTLGALFYNFTSVCCFIVHAFASSNGC